MIRGSGYNIGILIGNIALARALSVGAPGTKA